MHPKPGPKRMKVLVHTQLSAFFHEFSRGPRLSCFILYTEHTHKANKTDKDGKGNGMEWNETHNTNTKNGFLLQCSIICVVHSGPGTENSGLLAISKMPMEMSFRLRCSHSATYFPTNGHMQTAEAII